MFIEHQLPLPLAPGSLGGPERRTQIVTLDSGAEHRSTPWFGSRRRYDLAGAIQSRGDLAVLVDFFEACRGRLNGFRFRDPLDHRSSSGNRSPAPTDQTIGLGDGINTDFQLIKTYGQGINPWTRRICKPCEGSVTLALDGAAVADAGSFSIDHGTGMVQFKTAPLVGVEVSAGYLYDVPVRFDIDHLKLSLSGNAVGRVPSLPIVELLL